MVILPPRRKVKRNSIEIFSRFVLGTSDSDGDGRHGRLDNRCHLPFKKMMATSLSLRPVNIVPRMTTKNFTDATKVRPLRWGGYPGLCRWALNATTNASKEGGRARFDHRQKRKRCDQVAEIVAMLPQACEHQQGQAKSGFSPRASGGSAALPTPPGQLRETDFTLLGSGTVRE